MEFSVKSIICFIIIHKLHAAYTSFILVKFVVDIVMLTVSTQSWFLSVSQYSAGGPGVGRLYVNVGESNL